VLYAVGPSIASSDTSTPWSARLFDGAKRKRTLHPLSLAFELVAERGDTPGCRAAGIRRLNLRWGRQVSLPGAVGRVALNHAAKRLTRRLNAADRERVKLAFAQQQRAAPRLAAARQRHAGDPAAQARALHQVMREQGLPPRHSVAAQLARGIAVAFLRARLCDLLLGQTMLVERPACADR
jgi:hypothetical protein